MPARFSGSLLFLVALLAATLTTYTSHLDSAPVYMAPDEAHFTAHASSLAAHGSDLYGNRLPLFFRISDPLIAGHSMQVWYQPLLFYMMAASFTVQPVSEWSARAPVALIGVLNVWLIYLVARRLFSSTRAGVMAAAMLAMTPAHFIFSRLAVDYICPLPFVLTWMLFVLRHLETRQPRDLVGAGLVLGLGLFSYISSWMVMPLLGLITLVVVRPGLRNAARFAAAGLAPVAGLLLWRGGIVVFIGDALGRYRLGASGSRATILDTLLNFNLAERVSLYWRYFDPSFLLFAGGADLMTATSRAGVFLLATAVLIAVGVIALWRERSRGAGIVLIGFVLAPLPIVLVLPETPQSSIGRAMTMIVFGTLIAAAGARDLFRRGGWARIAALGLVATMPLQFAAFRTEYLTAYQEHSAIRFDPHATRDVIAAVAKLDQAARVPLVLLNDDGGNTGIRWLFYTLKDRRPDLWARTQYFHAGAFEASAAPRGTVMVMPADDPRSAALVEAGSIKVSTIHGIGGFAAADIFQRDR